MGTKKSASKKKGAKKRRLGVGLSGMIGAPVQVGVAEPTAEPAGSRGGLVGGVVSSSTEPESGFVGVLVGEIRPNERQPRQAISSSSLEPLVASIRLAGVMQPIIVRPRGADGLYELVAGERRWRAASQAGLDRVPAIVRDIDDQTAAEWAIVENVQREDLDAIERADAFRRLQAEFGLTHAEIADQVGMTRSAVTNQIRLCELDEGSRTLVKQGALSGGHGRCLLGVAKIEHRLDLAKQAIEGEWSVRELERRVRGLTPRAKVAKSVEASPDSARAHLDDLERQLGEYLGTRVQIHTGRKRDRGKLAIEFYDLEQFDGLLTRLGFSPK
ncbi:MAG: ParB/RepB/Spo0J family partition protein [Planctomycetes bacterium]|nr:ParB/RepB/Spo0J family partition protein [Planctomycetota bacterium]MCP4838834.1 ParB/RepB/Spo0J family partition protein [Planctomycetota bacterium]